MMHHNVKQRWVRLLVLLLSMTVSLAFKNQGADSDFENVKNETELNSDGYRSPYYEQIYDHPPDHLQWINNFTDSKRCQRFWTCSNVESNSSKVRDGFCFCDKICTLFRDCCEDSFTTNSEDRINEGFNTTTFEKQIGNEDVFQELQPRERFESHIYKCLFDYHENEFIYTIVSCPTEYVNSQVKQNCEDPQKSDRLLQVPVSGFLPGFRNQSQPIKFFNLYCALCHGVRDYEFWQPKFDCYNSSKVNETGGKYSEQNHSIEYIENHLKCKEKTFKNPLKVKTRDCFPFNDVCQKETSDEMNLLCHQGPFNPIFLPNVGNKMYKNIYCAYCNSAQKDVLSCNRTGYIHPNLNIYDLNGRSLSKLYNFNIFKQTCDKNEIYDFYRGICRTLISLNDQACEEKDLNQQNPISPCPKCKLIKLDKNEYRQFGDSVYFQKSHLTVNKSLLHFINDNSYICADHYAQKNLSQSPYMFDNIEVYITIIGLTLSILALLVTFGVYACFRSLRNVPGKMSMNLVASMFLANLLFIFSNDRLVDVICTVVAVCMHYTYLVSFFWMNALSFDAWNTFSKTTIGRRSKHGYKYYLIYCWITPLIIVSFSIFVNFSPFDVFPPWLAPKYGPPLCWISNKWALLIFFAAPLFLLILSNVVFYILTICAIYRTEKFSNRLLSKKNKGMFLIYLKLCFIMGINWIFAFLHTFTGITIIRYLSVFFNSFQGFWVGCSYLFSKQVWRQLKETLSFMFKPTERTDSDLSRSKQTSGTFVSGSKSGNGTENLMGRA